LVWKDLAIACKIFGKGPVVAKGGDSSPTERIHLRFEKQKNPYPARGQTKKKEKEENKGGKKYWEAKKRGGGPERHRKDICNPWAL